MKSYLKIIPYLICILFASCASDDSRPTQTPRQVNVALTVTLPEPENVHSLARSYTDSEIRNVDVLVFDEDGKFMERVKVDGGELTPSGTEISFSIRLDATSKRRVIHLVTNGRTPDGVTDRLNFGDVTPAMLESVAMLALKTSTFTGTLVDNVMPLIMWGRVELPTGINIVTNADNVKLLRAVACVQVKKGAVDATNGLNDFTVQSITVNKGADCGYLTPTNYSTTVTPVTGRPLSGSTLNYANGWSDGETPSLYIYERNCTSGDYMGVIIKAMYKGKEGYYKVVMVDNGGTPLNVVRNHRYIITVVSVNGPGYASVTDAINFAPSNALKVELTDEDSDFPCIVADAQHRMTMSNNVFNLYGKNQTTSVANGIEICTVYSSRGVTPVVTGGTTWLTGLQVQSLGNNKFKIVGNFAGTSTLVSTTLTLTCDNLSQSVEVSWNPEISTLKDSDSYVLDLVNVTNHNWTIQIMNPSSTTWLALHPTASLPAAFPGVDGFLSELNSNYYTHAYLHIGFGSNRNGRVQMSSVVGGKTKACKIIIVQ
ncbi:FimB/Mfa2 family fimbrial subunit [Butyricimonas paravirosa]|uniref:FimB/Mfa2 family fimbrial subunit n=1 Tax=Butyricimonas paravirosa TaxID=1472417 RepID=UPI0022E13BA1|nr:FimB/Mfa2 family fimbrial subunit [Butyricimonas paravirosa]